MGHAGQAALSREGGVPEEGPGRHGARVDHVGPFGIGYALPGEALEGGKVLRKTPAGLVEAQAREAAGVDLAELVSHPGPGEPEFPRQDLGGLVGPLEGRAAQGLDALVPEPGAEGHGLGPARVVETEVHEALDDAPGIGLALAVPDEVETGRRGEAGEEVGADVDGKALALHGTRVYGRLAGLFKLRAPWGIVEAMSEQRNASRRGLGLVLRRLAGVLCLLVAAILVFVLASVAYLRLDADACFKVQATRLAALEAAPASASASLAADNAVPDGLPFGKLRLLATHNSYRRQGTRIGLFFIGLIQPGEPARLAYSHLPLYDQLEAGIRSFELDVRARTPKAGTDGLVIAHVPLVDARTDEPGFALAIRELALWSGRNPGHVPLVVLLELKEDYMFLDPALRSFDAAALDRLDAAIRKELGSSLFSPRDRAGRGWPTVGALRGKVIVVLHENEKLRAIYEGRSAAAEAEAAMFTCLPGGVAGSAFAILNEPVAEAARISAALAAGVIVRTRADADLDIVPANLEAALASGAQILSTDFPPYQPGPDGYVAALPGGLTMDGLAGSR